MIYKLQPFFRVLSYLLVIALVVLNVKNFFFWDTVQLGSAHANYYFSTHFSNILLPDGIDSGHIPAFGMYLALLWKLFGRSIIISHLAMLPFAIGIVWQLSKICQQFILPKYSGIAVLLILADPTLLSQITLVSPDVPLVFFFLLGLNSILKNKQGMLSLSIFFLFLTSMRGMMVSFCLLCLDIYCTISFKTSLRILFLKLIKRSLIYLPGFILFIAYNSYHYAVKGWIGYHQDSPWAKSFERVDFKGFLFNIGLLGWRILDYGRAGIWLVFFILFIKYRKQIFKSKQTVLLLLFTLCVMVLLPLNMLWAKNLMGYRYLIPIYLLFSLLSATILFSDFVKDQLKYFLASLWLLVLLSGNFWIYPPKIAQGWDSTLAHLPYYKLRIQALNYLNHQKINFKDVQSFFPNTATFDRIDLNHDPRNFDTYDGKSKYVFFSNIYNVDDATYDKITSTYAIVKEFKNKGVYIVIYKRTTEGH
jgi:hypothetical protein